MSINGVNNNFNPTIDGLTTFQISDIVCDTLAVNNNTQLSGTNIINGNTTMTGTVNVNATANLNGVVNIPLYIRIKDNTNATYYTQLSQGSTGFSINNNSSSGSILLAVKDAIGTQVNALTINSTTTTFATNLTFNGDVTMPSKKITQTGTLLGFNTLSSTLIASGCYLAFTSNSFIDQQSNVGSSNNFKPTYMNVDANLVFNAGSGIINQVIVGSTGTNNLKSTTVNGTFTLATGGTLSLPNNSISDSALSSNVVLLTASQTLTNKTIDAGTFTNISNFNGYVDTYAGLGVNSGTVLTFGDSTNTIFSQINQFNNTMSITNYGTGSVAIVSPSVDLTNTYTYMAGAEMIGGNQFTQYDTTTTYGTALSQSSTNYLIENQYNSSSIILRNKNASGVAVDHTFGFNAVSINAPLTLGTNCNLILTGSGIIDQTSSTGENILSSIRFINTTSVKQITLFRNSATNLANNYTISVENPSTLRYNVSSGSASHVFSYGSGVNTYGNFLTISGAGLTQGLGNYIQSSTSIISQSGTGVNLMKNITLNVNNNLLQSGIGVITQSGTGTNALKGTTFSASNSHFNGASIIQYDSTNAVTTTLSQATTNSYLIENNYNSSDIYLRNKDATGVAVNHVFAHNGVTLGANLLLANSLIGIFQHGVGNQTNIRQSSSSFIVNNITNSGSTVLRTFNSTGSASVDGITTSYTGTTIANTLTLTNNTNLPSTQVTQTSGQLGYIHQGTILNVPSPVTMTTGTTYYLASMTLPVGLWNVFAQTSYTFSTGGTITYDYATIATNATSISNDDVLTSGNVTAGTGNGIIRRLNGIFSSTGSTVLYVNIQAVFGAGPVLQYSNTSQTYTRFYAVRIA
jgi:hypothetical protein